MLQTVIKYIQQQLDISILKHEQVYGGDINNTYILFTQNQQLFLKLDDLAKPGMFEAEFKGLGILRNTNAIAIPHPLLYGVTGQQQFLLMECIQKGTVNATVWQSFGHRLAALHRSAAGNFGLDHDNYIGSIPQPNKHYSTWAEFYAENRILYLIRKAFDEKKCDSSDTRKAEKLCNLLPQLFPVEPPSLIHGDLWSGNYMVNNNGEPVIYDPAVYYGHREMDLGMSLLFGGFDKCFYSFYNEGWPLEKDWQQRTDLTQLYPLLVHLILFGGHYYQSVKEILRKYTS